MNQKSSHTRSLVLESASRIVAPLVHILSAVGITEAELNGICERHYKSARRSRKRRVLKVVVRDPRYPDIITRWVTQPRYQDTGRPALLRAFGRSPSFASLVRETEPSLSPQEVLRDWRRAKIVRLTSHKRVKLLERFVPTKSGNEFDFGFLATMTSDFLRAHEFNVLHGKRRGHGLFQRLAHSYDVHPRLATDFNSFAREQAALLLESIDDWLARHQMPKRGAQKPIRLGMGIYVVNETVRERGRRGRQFI
jgi:Family of unknown function (DUF6502)